MHYPYHSSLCPSHSAMLIKTSYRDVPTKANGRSGTMRIYLIEPNVPEYPEAKFPGCVVFSEIYQVTGPVER
jgi:carboxymethylenebutenolidase